MDGEILVSIKPTNFFLAREMEINDDTIGFVKGIFIPYGANETSQDKYGNEYLNIVLTKDPSKKNDYLAFQKFSREHIEKLKFAGYSRPKLIGRAKKVNSLKKY